MGTRVDELKATADGRPSALWQSVARWLSDSFASTRCTLRIRVAEKVAVFKLAAAAATLSLQFPADSGLVHGGCAAARTLGTSGGMSQNQPPGEHSHETHKGGMLTFCIFHSAECQNFLAAIGHQTLLIAHS